MEVVSNGLVGPSPLHHHQHQHQHQHQNHQQHHQHPPLSSQELIIHESSSTEENEAKIVSKKRAETWVQDEIRSLIAFRSEIDGLFNTSKSNKHLWEQISMKMRGRGFDRSPAMCTDKWRNLLKDYKKAKDHDKGGSSKVSCYKDLEELLRQRSKVVLAPSPPPPPYRSPGKMDPYNIHYSPKATQCENQYNQCSPKGHCKSTLNLDRRLDPDGQSLALPSSDTIVETGSQPWGWRDPLANGEDEHQIPGDGKVITVKYGSTIRKIGIDGTFEAIKEAIKCAFGLHTRRAFWLEDDYGIVRSFDREMPLGSYVLHLDEGVTIKVCLHDESGHLMDATEEKTFYSDDDFYEFLRRRRWIALRDVEAFRDVDCLDDLHPMRVYQRSLLLHD